MAVEDCCRLVDCYSIYFRLITLPPSCACCEGYFSDDLCAWSACGYEAYESALLDVL